MNECHIFMKRNFIVLLILIGGLVGLNGGYSPWGVAGLLVVAVSLLHLFRPLPGDISGWGIISLRHETSQQLGMTSGLA